MTDWPERLNAYQFFLGDRFTEGGGDRVAVRTDQGDLTYAEVDRLVAGYGAALADAGVGKGDRVLIVMPDGPGFAASLLAVIRRGAVGVMLNPGLTTEAMGAIVTQSRAAAAVVDGRHREHFAEACQNREPRLLDPSRVEPGEHEEEPVDTAPDDPVIWLFSGGTTGLPKSVVQTHKSLVNTTRLYGQGSLGINRADITLSVPKLYFGYATGSNLLFPFSVGASVVLFEEHPTPAVLFDRIERHRPTVLINVPSAINQMVSAPDASTRDLSSLRVATSAGEALPETLYHRWKETFGVELLDGLGTAEMWHIFVTNTVGDVRPGTLGKVVPGYEIKVCDEAGEELGPGEVGRLWVRGDSIALGYHDNPEATADAFRGEWFVGGDLVSIDEEGYVTHRGRGDDAIKVKGKWFRPQEVESVLLDHPAVKACAVVAVDDEAGLARPVAFVVPAGDTSEQELVEWVLERLEPYKHPRRVHFVDELPQTHLGKVDRGALKRAAG
ncbi:MAG TPA: benzoate-CoA ligase family protein [Acidimicrobiia bacterium]|nr:benzoate-CoA ligase family protein [Acidimicrobiia bacterium]